MATENYLEIGNRLLYRKKNIFRVYLVIFLVRMVCLHLLKFFFGNCGLSVLSSISSENIAITGKAEPEYFAKFLLIQIWDRIAFPHQSCWQPS